MRDVLVAGLGTRAFVLGFDSKFGRDRAGTPALIESLGHEVRVVPPVEALGRPVSSTAIREAVELGDLAAAAEMLGRAVSVLGTVVRGEALGRRLGFPTANLDLHHELHPPAGVYAGFARRIGPPTGEGAGRPGPGRIGDPLPAVANIGTRPTVTGDGQAAPRVEVHLLDFEGDLYGEQLELEFRSRLRAEQRFDGIEALSAQIAQDVAAAREVLGLGA